jgi:hypothetical protein
MKRIKNSFVLVAVVALIAAGCGKSGTRSVSGA